MIPLTCDVYVSHQSWWWVETITDDNGNRLRVTIRANTYAHQSHAKVEVWTAEGWAHVAAFPPELWSLYVGAGGMSGFYLRPEAEARPVLLAVRDELLSRAEMVLR